MFPGHSRTCVLGQPDTVPRLVPMRKAGGVGVVTAAPSGGGTKDSVNIEPELRKVPAPVDWSVVATWCHWPGFHTNPLRAAWIVLLQNWHPTLDTPLEDCRRPGSGAGSHFRTPDPKLPAMHAGLPGTTSELGPGCERQLLRTERGVVRQPEEIVDAIQVRAGIRGPHGVSVENVGSLAVGRRGRAASQSVTIAERSGIN